VTDVSNPKTVSALAPNVFCHQLHSRPVPLSPSPVCFSVYKVRSHPLQACIHLPLPISVAISGSGSLPSFWFIMSFNLPLATAEFLSHPIVVAIHRLTTLHPLSHHLNVRSVGASASASAIPSAEHGVCQNRVLPTHPVHACSHSRI
jgi:hypothetical protein